MRFVLFVFILVVSSSSAQTDCQLIEKATVAYCKDDPEKAASYLYGFKLRNPKHPLYNEAHYLMAVLQHKLGDDSTAIKTANALLDKLPGESIGTDDFDDCPAPTDSIVLTCHLFRGITNTGRIKDATNILLMDIYLKRKDYNTAIKYFNKV